MSNSLNKLLPNNFNWIEIDICNSNDVCRLFDLLYNNYVEDFDATLRFAYSTQFLKWSLGNPNYKKEWHLGITYKSKIIAFIGAIPTSIRVNKNIVDIVDINFLCIHKDFRNRKLTPILISEITKRVSKYNILSAIHTTGKIRGKQFCTTKYMHRCLNYGKLVNIGFCSIPENAKVFKNPIKMLEIKYRLPCQTIIKGFRKMTKKDVSVVHKLLKKQLEKYEVAPIFNLDEITHKFQNINGVVNSYVVENENNITDFISYYTIESSILNNPKYNILVTGYLYYYANTKHDLKDLVKDCVISARNNGCDVFNCLDVMDNKQFIKNLLFTNGTGELYYHLFNYQMDTISADKLGVVML